MNLILSVAAGYNWKQIEIFIRSLRRFYSQKVILILNNPITDLISRLIDFDLLNYLALTIFDYKDELLFLLLLNQLLVE